MRPGPLLVSLSILAGCLASGRPAWAEEGESRSWMDDWHLGLEATTDLPLLVGGQITLEMPYGFRVTTSGGALIPPYVNLVNQLISVAGAYDQSVADVIGSCLVTTPVWKFHVGWRPFRRYGFYVETGYRVLTLGAEATPSELIEQTTGQSGPEMAKEVLSRTYRLESTLHMIDIEVGWELVLVEHLVLRFALGVALTVGATTDVPAIDFEVPEAFKRWVDQRAVDGTVDNMRHVAGEALNDLYRTYAFVPTVSVGLGYRFF